MPDFPAALVEGMIEEDVVAIPRADLVVSPPTLDAASRVLRYASEHQAPVLIWGGGHHQDLGYPIEPVVVITTRRLNRIVDWQPDDLTVVVESGVTLDALETHLSERSQSAVLPEGQGEATVGGVVAAGISGWRRFRYGPTRDRVLQTELVTGDGRVVTAGGRVVKNVSGYDIPRLVTGSFGSLGVIGAVCLKLWPDPPFTASVAVEDATVAVRDAYRPLAVLETSSGANVYLAGMERDVRSQAERLGGEMTTGLQWPSALSEEYQFALRVPPASVPAAAGELHNSGVREFRAAHGVGEVTFGVETADVQQLGELRTWAEAMNGSLVTTRGVVEDFDPWGTPPDSVDLQRGVKAAFDPAGVSNPGRLPGHI